MLASPAFTSCPSFSLLNNILHSHLMFARPMLEQGFLG